MCLRSKSLSIFFLFAVVAMANAVYADVWQGNLKSGGVVRIDAKTHKPTVFYSGGSTQLWDGVHEMDDGSVVVVRDGVAVPNEVMFNTWSQNITETLVEKSKQCKKLIRKTCGFEDQCAERMSCKNAQQLMQLQQDQPINPRSKSESGCAEALSDHKTFPECLDESGAAPTACKQLMIKSCGEQNACQSSVACDLAQQLWAMERDERLGSENPAQVMETGKQCQEAMDNRFFKACSSPK